MSENGNIIYTMRHHAPCGELILGACDGRLCLCDWMTELRWAMVDRRIQRALKAEFVALSAELAGQPTEHAKPSAELLQEASRQLDAYFRRERKVFDLPLLLAGTDFQKRVWEELMRIPYGTTLSYAQFAIRLGAPQGVRAVARANGANALSILVPCHRIIAADGSLTGYAGGLRAKQYLLNLESPDIFSVSDDAET